MIVPLIPLFLVASINLTENEIAVNDHWKYGPEAIYEVRFECAQCIWYERDYPETAAPVNETLKLSCRPKSRSSLSCQLYSQDGLKITTLNWEEARESEIFELNFDSVGLQKIIVSTRMDPSMLDTIRAVVAQLNVAADIFAIRKQQFEISENFFTGTCQTNYNLTSEKNLPDEGVNEKSFKTFLVPEAVPRKGQIRKMERIRNLDKCHKRLDYFFSNMEPLHTTPSTFETKLISSKSLMTIGESDFSSWTENTIVMKSKSTLIEETLTEKITLTLEDIVPAALPMITFKGPTISAPIFLKKWVANRHSEEDSSSEESQTFEDKTN